MKYLISLSFIIATCIGCSRVSVSRVTPSSNLRESFFYALPRNTLDLEVKVKKTMLERRNLANWSNTCITFLAAKYNLDQTEISNIMNNTKYEEYGYDKDGISVAVGSKPDTNKIYQVNVNPRFFVDNVVGLTFTQDYILSEASASSENKAFELALTTIGSLLGALTNLKKSPGGVPIVVAPPAGCFTAAEAAAFKDLDDAMEEFSAFITGNNLPNNTEAFQASKNYYEKKVQDKFEKALYKKSEKVYSIKFSIDLANAMPNGPNSLFRLVSTTGTLEINNAFSIRSSTADKITHVAVAGANWYTIDKQRFTDDVYSIVTSRGVTPPNESGFVYNIPGTASFTLRRPDNSIVFSNTYKIAQFGTTGSLNPKFTKASITLDPITGSLLKASSESKATATSSISGTGELAGKAKDAFKGTTEIEELEKQAKLLELKAKIKEFETKQ